MPKNITTSKDLAKVLFKAIDRYDDCEDCPFCCHEKVNKEELAYCSIGESSCDEDGYMDCNCSVRSLNHMIMNLKKENM